jgi:hypothetical protein
VDITKLSNSQFAALFTKIIEKIKEDPIQNFIRAKGFMDFSPTPSQTVALKVIFNKKLDNTIKHKIRRETLDDLGLFDIEDLEMTEVQIFEFMTGRTYLAFDETDETTMKNMINLIVGRRGGKTTLSAMLAIYCAISTNWKIYLQKTTTAHVLILSHSRDFSDEVLDLIRTLIEDSPILSRLINRKRKNTASTMNLSMPFVVDGKIQNSRVTIKVGAASKKTTRGTAACAVLCDEIAFWNLDESSKESDVDVLKAVRPNMKQFGRLALMIKLSSPGIKQGVLYDEYLKWNNNELPKNYVVFKAPSWVWNTILPKQEFIDEWKLDPDGFNTEYRANFVDSLSNFILPEFVDMAVMNGVKFNAPEGKGKEDKIIYRAAIDAAFKGDHFTFSVVGYNGHRIKQYISKGWAGTRQEPVKSSDVAQYIRTICKEYDIAEVAADQFAFNPLREIFEKYGVTLKEYTFNPTFKKKIYFNLKKLVHSQQIDLVDNPIQTKEIKELVVEQSNAGNFKIGHPSGGSDDYSDSMAIASFLVTEAVGGANLKVDFGMSGNHYDIKVDNKGTAFTAPSVDMISERLGGALDNSHEYIIDSETGKLVKKSESEDEVDDGVNYMF